MTIGLRVVTKAHFHLRRKGHKQLETGDAPPPVEPGHIPRVSRMMALAIHYDGLVRQCVVTDQADLARLGQVTRARVTQIMNLLQLAPDVQEQILFLPRIQRGREPVQEHELRQIAAVPDWRKQRRLWKERVQTKTSRSMWPTL